MAASPRIKVFNAQNDYRASFKDPSEAAAFVVILGEGATIRCGHSKKTIVWTVPADGGAENSYDTVAQIAIRRAAEMGRPL